MEDINFDEEKEEILMPSSEKSKSFMFYISEVKDELEEEDKEFPFSPPSADKADAQVYYRPKGSIHKKLAA